MNPQRQLLSPQFHLSPRQVVQSIGIMRTVGVRWCSGHAEVGKITHFKTVTFGIFWKLSPDQRPPCMHTSLQAFILKCRIWMLFRIFENTGQKGSFSFCLCFQFLQTDRIWQYRLLISITCMYQFWPILWFL